MMMAVRLLWMEMETATGRDLAKHVRDVSGKATIVCASPRLPWYTSSVSYSLWPLALSEVGRLLQIRSNPCIAQVMHE